ncbi:MAG: hypothetical protein V5A55_10180 [Halovenus sp.]
MRRRKFLLGSAAALTGTGLLAGAQGFSRTESQREVKIEVADDEDAYLGIIPEVAFGETWEVDCEGELELVLRNQAKEDLLDVTIEPSLEGEGIELEDDELNAQIELGKSETVTVSASCDPGTDGATAQLRLEISAEGKETEDTLIQAHRALTVECSCPEIGLSFVAFCGDVGEGDIHSLEVYLDDEDRVKRVTWETIGGFQYDDLDQVVLYGGFGEWDFAGKQTFLNFTDGFNDGEVVIGEEDQSVARNPPEETSTGQSPDCPCGEGGSGVKFEREDGGFPIEETFDCTDPG